MEILSVFMIVVLFLNLGVLLFGVKVIRTKGGMKFLKLYISRKVNPKQVSETNQKIIEQFSYYPTSDNDIVFLGDSIIEMGKWHEFFPEVACRNRGIGGDTTGDILARVNHVLEAKPKKIILLMGINDLLGEKHRNKTFENFQQILEEINLQSPKTVTYIMGVLPINKQKCDEILSPKKKVVIDVTNQEIDQLNRVLKKICGPLFINNYAELKDSSGEFKESFTYDGVHLNFEGYIALCEILKSYVYEEEYAAV